MEFGCKLVGLDQDADGVTARLAGEGGEEVVRVRYLVGADGGRSFVRHALDIGFPGKTLGVRAVVADVVLAGLARDAWHRFNEGSMERRMSLCPLAGTELFQLQAPIALEGEVDLSADGLLAMVAERTGRDDIRIQSVSWASAFQMNARLADSFRVGRVFLIGDAAHIHPPTGAQGLNTSVQDAYNLGWKLAAVVGGAPDALLDSYEEERRPIAAGMLGLTTKLLEAAKRGEMRRGREVRQLDLGYLESSLALEKPARGAACSRATAHLMRRSAVLLDSRRDCSSCSRAPIGRYWATRSSVMSCRRIRGCASIRSVRAAISLMSAATYATPTLWHPVIGCLCVPTAMSERSSRPTR